MDDFYRSYDEISPQLEGAPEGPEALATYWEKKMTELRANRGEEYIAELLSR